MNDSGVAVCDILERFFIGIDQLLVLVDDIHLDVGRMRFRRSGSDGGHNGLSSVISELADEGFARVRLGVGQAPQGVSQIHHVLGRFMADEISLVNEMIERSAEAVRTWCGDGVENGMNRFNNR
jgi:PTH1 family peptidyl-tRNA hydrolase